MYFNDHGPPHFHARRDDEEVTVGVRTKIVTGTMSAGPLRSVLDWAGRHQEELMENWTRARSRQPLKMIQED